MSNINDAKQLILETEIDNVIEEGLASTLINLVNTKFRNIKNPLYIIKTISRKANNTKEAPVFLTLMKLAAGLSALIHGVKFNDMSKVVTRAFNQLDKLKEELAKAQAAGPLHPVTVHDRFGGTSTFFKQSDLTREFHAKISEMEDNIREVSDQAYHIDSAANDQLHIAIASIAAVAVILFIQKTFYK